MFFIQFTYICKILRVTISIIKLDTINDSYIFCKNENRYTYGDI